MNEVPTSETREQAVKSYLVIAKARHLKHQRELLEDTKHGRKRSNAEEGLIGLADDNGWYITNTSDNRCTRIARSESSNVKIAWITWTAEGYVAAWTADGTPHKGAEGLYDFLTGDI